MSLPFLDEDLSLCYQTLKWPHSECGRLTLLGERNHEPSRYTWRKKERGRPTPESGIQRTMPILREDDRRVRNRPLWRHRYHQRRKVADLVVPRRVFQRENGFESVSRHFSRAFLNATSMKKEPNQTLEPTRFARGSALTFGRRNIQYEYRHAWFHADDPRRA
jgi:hypothetical protein